MLLTAIDPMSERLCFKQALMSSDEMFVFRDRKYSVAVQLSVACILKVKKIKIFLSHPIIFYKLYFIVAGSHIGMVGSCPKGFILITEGKTFL